MSLTLAYSRDHTCHNTAMIWQPAGHHWYCTVCHRKEASNEYVAIPVAAPTAEPNGDMVDQPVPA